MTKKRVHLAGTLCCAGIKAFPPLDERALTILSRQNEDGLAILMAHEIFRQARMIFGKSDNRPFIGIVVPNDSSIVGGRFFPSQNGILVYRHFRTDVTIATIAHELAHWYAYQAYCGGTKPPQTNSCPYFGQHDQNFYALLENVHRVFGTSPDAAIVVEGKYDFPNNWKRIRRF